MEENYAPIMEVRLEDVKFYARHGVFEQERISGNEFIVDLAVEFPCSLESFSDSEEDLGKSISYAELYSIVEEEMGNPRQLLETVACSIARKIRSRYPIMTKGSIKITKNIPPIARLDGRSAIKLKF